MKSPEYCYDSWEIYFLVENRSSFFSNYPHSPNATFKEHSYVLWCILYCSSEANILADERD